MFKLVYILVYEVCIEEYVKFGSSDKEVCYWLLNLREKLEKKFRCVDKVVFWYEFEMYIDGEEECGSCGGFGIRLVIVLVVVFFLSKINLVMVGNC